MSPEDLEGGPSRRVVSVGPCDACGSRDNLKTYADGHQYCFTPGCGLRLSSKKASGAAAMSEPKPARHEDLVPYTEEHLSGLMTKRKLTAETLRRYGYFIHKKGGKTFHIQPYYGQDGRLAYQKYRDADKNFFFTRVSEEAPDTMKCQLFGQTLFGEKNDRTVVVTEGEIDAMSVAQAVNFKIPVVSLVQGAESAVKSLRANYRWLDRFASVVLWMDMDEPGQAQVARCAELFETGKLKVVNSGTYKDASEMLQAGKAGEIYNAVYSATAYAPPGIVNARDLSSDMLEDPAVTIASLPWPKAQSMLLGIREKEVVYHVGGTGIGKTSIIVELQHHLLKAGIKFGVMRFEDTRQKVQLDLMSREVGHRLHLDPLPREEMLAVHASVFGGGLVEVLDTEAADWSLPAILGYVRYMKKALGCQVIFIDPLSFLVAASDIDDERKALDRLAYELAQLVKKTGANLQITHHLSREAGKVFEEGAAITLTNIRGSAGIANFAMAVLAYERNQQGPRPDLTRMRVLKNRHAGTTGVADILRWDPLLGSLSPTNEHYPEDGEEWAPMPAPSLGKINPDNEAL